MAGVFTRKEVDQMIAEAVAKATAPLLVRIASLEAELAKAKKNSSNSSKPPSSDMVRPPKPSAKNGKKRKRGGQPGHPQHVRPIFPPEAVNHIEPHTLDCCPDCGGALRLARTAARRAATNRNHGNANDRHRASRLGPLVPALPEVSLRAVAGRRGQGGALRPTLDGLGRLYEGRRHASFSTIRKFLRDVAQVDVSRGYLAKLVAKASASLAAAYAELFARLPGEAVLNIDETGHKEYREKFWTWCFRAELYTLFRIDKLCGSKVLVEVLGTEFDGVLGCDYFGATASICASSTCWCSFAWHT